MAASKKRSSRPAKSGGSTRKKSGPVSFRGTPSRQPGISRFWNDPWLLIIGFLLTALGVLSFPNFNEQVPAGFLSKPFNMAFGLAGFLLLTALFRLNPPPPDSPEIPRKWAALWFTFFFGLTLYTRFCHPETPEATFWYDDLVVTGDVRRILDFNSYPLLLPWGQREPFFPYLNAFLWLLTPKADGVFINRLSSTLVDMGTCWGLYLLGRSLRGRLTGLFLMALYAVSKPFIVYCYFGYGANTCALSTVWMMVFFIRLVQKPVFRRFVYLGAALGFGAYTYVPARVWTPYLIGILWLWIIHEFRKKSRDPLAWSLLAGVMTAWAFLFLSKNNLLDAQWPWVSFLSRPAVSGAAAALLFGAYVKTGLGMKKDEFRRRVFGWATLALVTYLLTSPFLYHPLYANHLSDTSALHLNKKIAIGSEALKLIGNNTLFFFTMMFGQSHQDLGTYPTWVGSFFDYLPVVAIAVGLAFFVARPGWMKLLILSLTGIGMLPFVLTNHAHSARVLTVLGPLFLMAGWGMEALYGLLTRGIPGPAFRRSVLLVLLALWGWNAYWSNQAVWAKWMYHKSNDAVIFQEVDKDWRNYRVFVAPHYPEFESAAFTMLCDQKDVWFVNDPNPIALEPGEASKDIVLLFWGYDQKMEARLKSDFPEAHYSVIPSWSSDRPRFIERVVIPFSSLSETPGKLFYIARAPRGYWHRRFFWSDYGIARGLVWWEDRVPLLNSSMPPKLNVWMSGEATGDLNVSTKGDYFFNTDSAGEFLRLSVDGKKIMDFVPQDGVTTPPRASLPLSPGPHRITVTTYFQHGPSFPKIRVKPPSGPDWFLGETPAP